MAVADFGTILTSRYAGNTWTSRMPPAGDNNRPSAVACRRTGVCLMVGSNSGLSTILASADGGKSWMNRTSGANDYLNGVTCTTDAACLVVGGVGTILASVDAGSRLQ